MKNITIAVMAVLFLGFGVKTELVFAQDVITECNAAVATMQTQYEQKKAQCTGFRSSKGSKSPEYIQCKVDASTLKGQISAKKAECRAAKSLCSDKASAVRSTKRTFDREKNSTAFVQRRLGRERDKKRIGLERYDATIDSYTRQRNFAYAQSGIKCAMGWFDGAAAAACSSLLQQVERWETKIGSYRDKRNAYAAKEDVYIARYEKDLNIQVAEEAAASASYDAALNDNSGARCPDARI